MRLAPYDQQMESKLASCVDYGSHFALMKSMTEISFTWVTLCKQSGVVRLFYKHPNVR